MIGKRYLAQESPVIIMVKSAPAAVTILHGQHPGQPSAYGSIHACLIGKIDPLQRHQYECCIVYVGVEIVSEFKRPAPGMTSGVLSTQSPRPTI